MTDMRAKMKADAKRAKQMAKEVVATLEFYSKKAWKALKNPLMSLSAAAIMSSCGIMGTPRVVNNTGDKFRKDSVEQVVKPVQQADSAAVVDKEPDQRVNDEYDAVPEFEKAREAEEVYWEIMEGKQTLGDNKTDYGKPGKGAPRLTEKDADEIYERQREIRGRGIDDVELGEMDKELGRNSDTSDSRDISMIMALKDAGYRR